MKKAKIVLRNRIGAELSSTLVHTGDVLLERHDRQEEVECALHSLLEDIGWNLTYGDTLTVEENKDG